MKHSFYKKWWFWVLLIVAVLGWYYAFTYYNAFWEMDDIATRAINLAEECTDLLRQSI